MGNPQQKSRWSLSALRQQWQASEPWQRRNALIGGAAVVWAAILTIDMSNLKKDPRLREKLQLDNPEKPQPSFTALYFDWINKKMKRNEDY
mmetsp:Transcript_4452/g.12112  ORF Transcript_4452/g.12112 Transcript_4452/m.12112 type:complete len:91 (+) Transcript_4452:166-438(+)